MSEGRREVKSAAAPRSAFYRDGSTHESHQTGSDCQPQTGAAVLSRGGRVLLLKGVEDALLLVNRNADPGIAYCEADANWLGGRIPRIGENGYTHDDFALIGEFDCVTNQIEEHLPQPACVANQGIGHFRLYLVNQLEPSLVGSNRQGAQRLADHRS